MLPKWQEDYIMTRKIIAIANQKGGVGNKHLRRPCRDDHAVFFILLFHRRLPPGWRCAS